MAEYIDREKLLDDLLAAAKHGGMGEIIAQTLMRYVKRQPAADVAQVVRCRDCKFNSGAKKCLNPDSFFVVPSDDDFCSYGELRDGGDPDGR